MCTIGSLGTIFASDLPTYVEFTVSHVNYPGAPSSSCTEDTVLLGHRGKGATATVSSCYNTDGSGTTGRTDFDCATYASMPRKSIYNLGSALLKPAIGEPTEDVGITYDVSAYTPQSYNTYWASGSIEKRLNV